MEDLEEFETNQMDLNDYMSNGIINEEDIIDDPNEIFSQQSYGLENMSNYNSIKLSNT